MKEHTNINHNFNNELFEENKRINREIKKDKIYARLTLLAIVLFVVIILIILTCFD